ncbi:MAG: hypothetical protein FWG19_03040, partial [Methanomassiliicoccaceae archaeon]|nr:hypothetical protein [Methanomassiliicoccaceae archaeon]
NSSTVTIGGNVTASGEYGILFLNNEIDSMSMVIINGTFTADDDQYVGFTDDGGNNIFTSKSEYTEISGGYYVYDLFEDAGFDAVLKVKAFIEVTFTAEQTGGSNGTADSTGIVIQFSDAVEGLTIGDITVTDDTGEVTVGTLSGSGAAWTVALTGVAAQGNVTVAVADFDAFVVTTAPQSVAVYKDTRTSVTFTAEQTGGSDGTADSTGIVIQFSDAVEGLTIRNITVTDDTGEVTAGTLTGSGTTWTVALTGVAAQGNVTVSVVDFDAFVVTTASQSVAVYKDTTIPGGDGGGDGDGNDDGSNMLIIAVAAVAVIVIALLAYFLVLRKR